MWVSSIRDMGVAYPLCRGVQGGSLFLQEICGGGIARYPARCYKSSYALYESGDSCDGRPRRRRETDATSTAGESIEGGSCSDRKAGGLKESSVNEEKAGAPCSPAFGVLMPNAPLKSASKFRTLPVYRNLHTPIKGIYQSGESLNGRTTSTPAV